MDGGLTANLGHEEVDASLDAADEVNCGGAVAPSIFHELELDPGDLSPLGKTDEVCEGAIIAPVLHTGTTWIVLADRGPGSPRRGPVS